MRRILLVLLITVAFVRSAGAQASVDKIADPETAKKEVLKLDGQFEKGLLAVDTHVLAILWADDFLYCGTGGEILTKIQRLAQLQSGAVKYDALKQDNLQVVIYGDTVVVSGRNTSTVLVGDKGSWGPGGISHKYSPGRRSGNALFTRVYVKLRGQWRIVLEHETYITDD